MSCFADSSVAALVDLHIAVKRYRVANSSNDYSTGEGYVQSTIENVLYDAYIA